MHKKSQMYRALSAMSQQGMWRGFGRWHEVSRAWGREQDLLRAACIALSNQSTLRALSKWVERTQARLAKLKARAQRELTRAASVASISESIERKRQHVREIKASLDKNTGRDVMSKLAGVPTPDEAEVVLACPYFYYQTLLSSAAHCDMPGVARTPPAVRAASAARDVTQTSAWNASKPHVYVGAVEYAADAYRRSGSVFGRPAAPFVLHANADHWPGGVARQHAIVPVRASDLSRIPTRAPCPLRR